MIFGDFSQSDSVWVKICGMNNPATIDDLCLLKPDALGFNFYEKSIRHVTPQMASDMIQRIPQEITPIGLFVNHTVDQIKRICDLTGITTIQLHGEEAAEQVALLRDYRIIRAVRLSAGQKVNELMEMHQQLQDAGVIPLAYLLDKRSTTGYGGTGEQLCWEMLATEYNTNAFPRMILAGGLNSSNVSEAIRIVKPFGVDVASGVEDSPGVKSVELCRTFISQAKGSR